MKLTMTKGATSQIVAVFIRDSSSTTGAGLTGLAYNSASLVASYVRPGAARTAITLATQTTTGAFSSGGFVEIDSTNMPGVYRLDVPDAAFATGVNNVVVMLKGATNMEPCVMEFALTGMDFQDTVRAGLTGLANATPGATGGLLIAGSNAATTVNITGNITGNLSGSVGSVTAGVNTIQLAGQTVTAAAGVTFPTSVASPTNITGGTITTVTNLTNAPTAGDLTATMKASVNAEVLDVLSTDTFAEPAQGAPGATVTLAAKIGYLYKAWRNKSTQTSSTYSLFNDDASTVDHKATVADDGTTLTRGEVATGP
jgi:hypothetical protein